MDNNKDIKFIKIQIQVVTWIVSILFGIMLSQTCRGQYCELLNFWTVGFHYKAPAGFGFEFGRWAGTESNHLSVFAGGTIGYDGSVKKKDVPDYLQPDPYYSTLYLKAMYPVTRQDQRIQLYGVLSAGIKNFDKFYPEAGARLVYMLNRSALSIEPLHDFDRLNIYLRLNFAL